MTRRTVAAVLAGLVAVAAACTSTDATTESGRLPSTPTSDSAAPPHLVEGPETSLDPGTYQFSVLTNPGVETQDALVEVPGGFDDDGTTWFVVSHDRNEFFGLWTVGLVARDACTSSDSRLFDPGPTVQDLANALVAQKSTRASAPKPVTLAGQEGLYVKLASPHDTSSCEDLGHIWESPGGRGPGSDQVDLVWILDVDGQRVVVDAAYNPKSTPTDIHKLTTMAHSLHFVEAPQT